LRHDALDLPSDRIAVLPLVVVPAFCPYPFPGSCVQVKGAAVDLGVEDDLQDDSGKQEEEPDNRNSVHSIIFFQRIFFYNASASSPFDTTAENLLYPLNLFHSRLLTLRYVPHEINSFTLKFNFCGTTQGDNYIRLRRLKSSKSFRVHDNNSTEPLKKRNDVVILSRCQTKISGQETGLQHRIEGDIDAAVIFLYIKYSS
jgi:hypothetical protein